MWKKAADEETRRRMMVMPVHNVDDAVHVDTGWCMLTQHGACGPVQCMRKEPVYVDDC